MIFLMIMNYYLLFVLKGQEKRQLKAAFFCYFLLRGITTLGNQAFAAKANCSSFAFTFFASSARNPQP